jgi:hypothetical protein
MNHLAASLFHPIPLSLFYPRTRHGMAIFRKPDRLTEPSRQCPSLSALKPYQARHRPCTVLFALYGPCSGGQQFVEHLACALSTPSSRADRLPPNLKPRQLPCLVFPYTLAQPRPIPLSPSFWTRSPPTAANTRTPCLDSHRQPPS